MKKILIVLMILISSATAQSELNPQLLSFMYEVYESPAHYKDYLMKYDLYDIEYSRSIDEIITDQEEDIILLLSGEVKYHDAEMILSIGNGVFVYDYSNYTCWEKYNCRIFLSNNDENIIEFEFRKYRFPPDKDSYKVRIQWVLYDIRVGDEARIESEKPKISAPPWEQCIPDVIKQKRKERNLRLL